MPAEDQTVTLWAGDTFQIRIPVVDQDGAYPSLSGATAKWWMGKSAKATGADVYLQKSSATDMVCDDGETRKEVEIEQYETSKWRLVVNLKGADTELGTSAIPKAGTYYHEAEIITADGNRSTVTIGPFVLEQTMVRNA